MTEQTLKDGPIVKFQLIKRYGAVLRRNGFEPRTMSCEQLRSAIKAISVGFDLDREPRTAAGSLD